MKLTKRALDAATYERQSGAQCLWDDELPGFGVRIYPSGRKAFVVTYRTQGRQRFHTVGRYGELTLQQARDLARETLVRVRRGGDPSGERRSQQQAPTIADLARRYMEEHSRPRKKASSIRGDQMLWRLHILPALKHQKVALVTRAEIAWLHLSLAKTPYMGNRVLALLSNAFHLAEVWGWRPDGSNPCRHVKRFREAKRERYLSAQELARLAAALAEAEHDGTELPQVIAAIRLLLLTGCRVGEVLGLRWQEVDFERRCLRLADSKTGSKVVHLNAPALEVLAGIEPEEGNPFVVPGGKPGTHLVNLKDPWRRLRRATGLADLRLHDLRHSFASVAAGIGLSLPMIGKLLGHTQAATTQRYAHLAADPVREATERVGAQIAAVLDGRAGAEVVTLHREHLQMARTRGG